MSTVLTKAKVAIRRITDTTLFSSSSNSIFLEESLEIGETSNGGDEDEIHNMSGPISQVQNCRNNRKRGGKRKRHKVVM